MKKLLLLLITCCVSTAFALGDVPNASLTPVKKTHHRVEHHKAHKATKHHAPKRNRHTI